MALSVDDEAREAFLIDDDGLPLDSQIKWRLYLSHALSAWNSRMFEFGAFLFLASIWKDDLLPASVYALSRSAAAALLLPWLGSRLDKLDRLQSVRLSLLSQRMPVAFSCAGFGILTEVPVGGSAVLVKVLALAGLSILACVEKLGAATNTIAIERDWVVVICAGNESQLASMNAQMRRIDLFCKLVGPLAIAVLDAYSTRIAVASMGIFTSLSLLLEYVCIARVYEHVDGLRKSKQTVQSPTAQDHAATHRDAVGSVTRYVKHPAFLPSLSLALLYLTVVSFSGQFITYLLAVGFNSTSVALLRTIATIIELSATWIAPIAAQRIGAVRTGLWSLNAQLTFICGASACLWLLPASKPFGLATYGLIACTILSRAGLWGYDLSAQLIIQDEVEPDFRGAFSSLEASLQNVFEMLAFTSTIVFPSTAQFKYPAAISAGAVTMASVLYACFVRGRRGHLMHFDDCLCRGKTTHITHAGWTPVNHEDDIDTSIELLETNAPHATEARILTASSTSLPAH